MGLEEYKGVYVFAQQVDNEISKIAFELLGKAKDLASDLNTDVTAVLLGSGIKDLADQLAEYGADKVIVVIRRRNLRLPATLHLSPTATKFVPQVSCSNPARWSSPSGSLILCGLCFAACAAMAAMWAGVVPQQPPAMLIIPRDIIAPSSDAISSGPAL